MKLLVVGTREDVAGFALAGVEGVICTSGEDAGQAIARADEDTMLVVSAEFARALEPSRLMAVLPARM